MNPFLATGGGTKLNYCQLPSYIHHRATTFLFHLIFHTTTFVLPVFIFKPFASNPDFHCTILSRRLSSLCAISCCEDVIDDVREWSFRSLSSNNNQLWCWYASCHTHHFNDPRKNLSPQHFYLFEAHRHRCRSPTCQTSWQLSSEHWYNWNRKLTKLLLAIRLLKENEGQNYSTLALFQTTKISEVQICAQYCANACAPIQLVSSANKLAGNM